MPWSFPRLVNALIVTAIGACAVLGWSSGLLALIALLVMEGVLELKALRTHAAAVAEVFGSDMEPMTEERAHELTEGVLERVKAEMIAQASRRPH